MFIKFNDMKRFTIDQLLEHYSSKIRRKNEHGEWIETTLNDDYIELMLEFPEDYELA